MRKLVYIDEVINAIQFAEEGIWGWKGEITKAIEALPSAQQEAISLEWIDKHLEWLDNCDNDFAQLAKVGIRAMVELWKKDRV